MRTASETYDLGWCPQEPRGGGPSTGTPVTRGLRVACCGNLSLWNQAQLRSSAAQYPSTPGWPRPPGWLPDSPRAPGPMTWGPQPTVWVTNDGQQLLVFVNKVLLELSHARCCGRCKGPAGPVDVEVGALPSMVKVCRSPVCGL